MNEENMNTGVQTDSAPGHAGNENAADSEIAEIKCELKHQRKMLTAILVFIIILACTIIIYLFYKMTIGSIFGHIIGFVTGLFGS